MEQMSAVEKTNALGRLMLPISSLVVHELNPNKMSDAEFNLLYDNIEQVGFVDPIFVRKLSDGTYRVIGGHHRLEVAKLLDFVEVPCTVIESEHFTEDEEKFQIVRMNMIRGKMDPKKFIDLWQSLSGQYAEEVIAESFGFADEKEFEKMIRQTKAKLPKDMQAAFDEGAKEIKTIDQLSKLLNALFSQHGDSLPYGYMLIDFGSQDSIWLRMSNDTRKALLKIGGRCRTEQRTMDDLIGGLIEMAAEGKLEDQLVQLIAKSKPADIPKKFVGLPTADALVADG